MQTQSFKQIFGILPALTFTAGLVMANNPPVEPVTDSFEGTGIYQFWDLQQTSGQISQSKDQAYSGSQSLKFKSTPGSQVILTATHKFPKPTKGTVSVSYYDSAPGQQTLYQYMDVSDSRNPNNSSGVGTQDFDANCYSANVASGTQGPNAPCGVYPQLDTTPVKRTLGWHVFSISYDEDSVSIAIDGTVIFTGKGDYYFDTVQLTSAGPGWRPAGLCYYDNFNFTPLPVYAK